MAEAKIFMKFRPFKTATGIALFAGLLLGIQARAFGADLSSDDKKFITGAAEGGQAEIDFAKLALKKSQNPDVQKFANRMITDHSKASAKLRGVASSKGVKPPSGIGVSNNAELLKLKALSGDTFNKSYVDLMVDDHKSDVEAFQKESESGRDPDLKRFAARTLPTLQEHYQMIQDIQSKMK